LPLLQGGPSGSTPIRPGSAAAQAGWQKDYFRGANPDGSTAPEHETRMRLKPFSREG
jgi:hypothetical protein